MDLDALVKAQQEWLDRATRALQDQQAEQSDPDAVDEASALQARDRLAGLEAQRDALVKRLDTFIAEEKAVIDRIEARRAAAPDTGTKPRRRKAPSPPSPPPPPPG